MLTERQKQALQILVRLAGGELVRKAFADLEDDDQVVFDGPEAFASTDRIVAELRAEIEAAGGLEAWRAQGMAARSAETKARPEGQQPGAEDWHDMAFAPLDGTLVRLLVKFDNHGIEDTDEPTATIGSHNDGEWNFVGWDWHRDEWTRGSGDLLGWLPMGPDRATPAAAAETAQPAAPESAEDQHIQRAYIEDSSRPGGFGSVFDCYRQGWLRASQAQPEPWALVTLLERLGAAAPQPAASGQAELLDALLAVFDDLAEREDDGDGNGPGHSHAVPGIWDPDNGIKAGAVCGWCNKWARAKGLRAAIAKDTAA